MCSCLEARIPALVVSNDGQFWHNKQLSMSNLPKIAVAAAVIFTTIGLRAAEPSISEPQPTSSGLLKLDAGVSLQDNIKVSHIAGFATDAKLEFDPGVRVSLAIGANRRLDDRFSLRFEFETGFLLNEMTKISGPGGSVQVDGSHAGVPLLANFILSYDITDRLKAFGGIGGGLLVSTISIDEIEHAEVGESSAKVPPVAQWTLGVDYSISERFSAILEYKGMAIFGAEYGFALGTVNTTTELSLNHSILAGVGFKF